MSEKELNGPCTIPCELKCLVPENVILKEIKSTKEIRDDVITCPYENCQRSFMIIKNGLNEKDN